MPDQELIKIRKELHTYPELSNQENETYKRITNFISKYSPDDIIENVGGNGLIGIYKANEKGPSVLIRCDMDALPIQEINQFAHKSLYPNIGHKCGHDGHMSIVLGLAKSLSKERPKTGKVMLLFQPAEETGEGALQIINDPRFKNLSPDYVFALHNLPAYPLHQVITKDNAFSASVTSMIIKLEGKTAHAAEPEHGINPSFAVSKIIEQFEVCNTNNPKENDFVVITPIYCRIGSKAYGTSAGNGEIHYTIRSWNQQNMNKLKDKLATIVDLVATKQLLKYDIQWTQNFQSNNNDIEANNIIKNAALLNGLELFDKKEPFKWGEDFGVFTQIFKGAMFGLGAGENTPALHNPDYDFPDTLIPSGINMFRSIIDQICSK